MLKQIAFLLCLGSCSLSGVIASQQSNKELVSVELGIVVLPTAEISKQVDKLAEQVYALGAKYTERLTVYPNKPHISVFQGLFARDDVTKIARQLTKIHAEHFPFPVTLAEQAVIKGNNVFLDGEERNQLAAAGSERVSSSCTFT